VQGAQGLDQLARVEVHELLVAGQPVGELANAAGTLARERHPLAVLVLWPLMGMPIQG